MTPSSRRWRGYAFLQGGPVRTPADLDGQTWRITHVAYGAEVPKLPSDTELPPAFSLLPSAAHAWRDLRFESPDELPVEAAPTGRLHWNGEYDPP